MKTMNKIVCLVLALVMVLGLAACGKKEAAPANELEKMKASGVMTVSMSPDFAPMEFVDSSKEGQEQYVGFDVTLAQNLADYFGLKLEIVPMSFDACPTAVSSGTVNMSISGFSWKADRAENYELTDTYHASDNEENQCILIREEDLDKYITAADFDGKVVGAQNSSLQQMLVSEQLPNAQLQTIGDIGVGVMELQQGNIDGLAVAEGNGKSIMLNNSGLVLAQFVFHVEDKYKDNLILVAKGETELCEAINEALAKFKAEDLYAQWYEDAVALAEALGEMS